MTHQFEGLVEKWILSIEAKMKIHVYYNIEWHCKQTKDYGLLALLVLVVSVVLVVVLLVLLVLVVLLVLYQPTPRSCYSYQPQANSSYSRLQTLSAYIHVLIISNNGTYSFHG